MVFAFLQLLAVLVFAECASVNHTFHPHTLTKNFIPPSNSFKYTAQLHCGLPGPWCAELFIFEVETLNIEDDPWHYVKVCSNKPTIELKLATIYPGGDGIIDGHYEVGRILYHNCTETVTVSDYNCKMNAYLIKCPAKFWFADMNPKPVKCGCTVPELKTVSSQENSAISEYIDLTNPSKNAYNSSDSDDCSYPTAFNRLNKIESRFPAAFPPCLLFKGYSKMETFSLRDFRP